MNKLRRPSEDKIKETHREVGESRRTVVDNSPGNPPKTNENDRKNIDDVRIYFALMKELSDGVDGMNIY